MSRSVFTPWPDKPLRMVDVMIIISIALGGSQKDTLGRWNAMGLSRDSVEECSLHNRIIQTALYSVLSRFTLYLLKLLCISATWEESLSVFWAYPEKLGAQTFAFRAEKQSRKPQSSAFLVWSHDYITELFRQTCLASPFPRKNCTPLRGCPATSWPMWHSWYLSGPEGGRGAIPCLVLRP